MQQSHLNLTPHPPPAILNLADAETSIDSYDLIPIQQVQASCQTAPGFSIQTLVHSNNMHFMASSSSKAVPPLKLNYPQSEGWLSCKNPQYPVFITLRLIAPTRVEMISLAFQEGKLPQSYSVYGKTDDPRMDSLVSGLDVSARDEVPVGIGLEIMKERRLGTFSNNVHQWEELSKASGGLIVYIKTNSPDKEKLKQVRLVIHQPNEGDPFQQVGLHTFCLYKRKGYYPQRQEYMTPVIKPGKAQKPLVPPQTMSKERVNYMKRRNLNQTFDLNSQEVDMPSESYLTYGNLSRNSQQLGAATWQHKTMRRRNLDVTRDSQVLLPQLPTKTRFLSMLDHYKLSKDTSNYYSAAKLASMPFDPIEPAEDKDVLERARRKEEDIKRNLRELELWEARLCKVLQEAVAKEAWEEAGMVKRERDIVRFQILQVKPMVRQVQERILDGQRLKLEIEDGTYKDRVKQIRQDLLDVESIINKLAPPKSSIQAFEEPIHPIQTTKVIVEEAKVEQEVEPPQEEEFEFKPKVPKRFNVDMRLRKYCVLFKPHTLVALQECSQKYVNKVAEILSEEDVQIRFGTFSQVLDQKPHVAIDFLTWLLREYESPVVLTKVLDLMQLLIKSFSSTAVLHRMSKYKHAALESLVVQLCISYSQQGKTNTQLLANLEQVFTSFFFGQTLHHPLPWLTVPVTTLVTDSCFPSSFLKSERLTFTRLTLLLKALVLTPSATDFISDQSNLSILVNTQEILTRLCAYLGTCINHKLFDIRLLASKCLRQLYTMCGGTDPKKQVSAGNLAQVRETLRESYYSTNVKGRAITKFAAITSSRMSNQNSQVHTSNAVNSAAQNTMRQIQQ